MVLFLLDGRIAEGDQGPCPQLFKTLPLHLFIFLKKKN